MSAELPPRAARQLKRAEQWARLGDAAAAEHALAQARALAPDHPDVTLATAALRKLPQSVAHALDLAQRAARRQPRDARMQIQLGRALRDARRFVDAEAALRTACELEPDLTETWFNLGTLLFVMTRFEPACTAFERAYQLAPHEVANLMGLAMTLQTLGRVDDAAARLREAIALQPDAVYAWQSLINLKTVTLSDDEVGQLEQVYVDAALPDDARSIAGFALGDAFERQRRHADALAVLLEANALKRRTLSWDAAAFSDTIDVSIAAFSQPCAEAADRTLGSEVIFVVSMPRSGSTLTEQILASHSDVEGASELAEIGIVLQEESASRHVEYPHWVSAATPADWERLGRRYLERTARWQTRPRFTDKGLSNWQTLGAAFAMLPGAKIVHSRRDPLETCWSCFKQLFPVGQPFTYDISELAAFWADYDRLMQFWHARYPRRIHDFVYEELLSDPDTRIRGLLDHTGLRFEDACLHFHESTRHVRTPSAAQVRQPLRADTARAPRYGELLAPLRDALHSAATRTRSR